MARAEEVKRLQLAAADRPSWAPRDKRDGRWDVRHAVTFSNADMNPNYRSYFDRHLEPSSSSGAVKPSWRLEPGRPSLEERDAARELRRWFSEKAIVEESTIQGASLSERRAARISRDRAFCQPPLQSSTSSCKKEASPAPERSESSGLFAVDAAKNAREEAQVVGWDRQHHVTWSNERTVGGTRLNPVQARNYFDRSRNPAPGERSVQPRHPRHVECVTASGEFLPSGPVERVVPTWRLDRELPSGNVPLQRPGKLLARTGHGGGLPAVERSSPSRRRQVSLPAVVPKKDFLRRSRSEGAKEGSQAMTSTRFSSRESGAMGYTFAASLRLRSKEEGRLEVDWKLKERVEGHPERVLEDSLRSCDVEEKEARRLEKRRSAWFSGHGVEF